jgi:tRNA(fMet)-specific endonuclease VapC
MILLDTSFVVDYLRNKPLMVTFIDTVGKHNFALSTAVTIELYQGVRNRAELITVQKELQQFNMIEIDNQISKVASQLAETYCLSHQMGLGDTLIAATALVFNLELRTYNMKDFRFIPTLRVSNSLE